MTIIKSCRIFATNNSEPEKLVNMKQKSHLPELISRPLVTTASQEDDAAKIQIISENARIKLLIVSKKYAGIHDPEGFITNLKRALGMGTDKASNYKVFKIARTGHRVTIRVSNHHANAIKYLEHEATDFNLSIMVSKRYRKNTFRPHPGVMLKEYVYMGRQLEKVDSPYSQVAKSIAGFLETGEYVDTTGVAKVNVSP